MKKWSKTYHFRVGISILCLLVLTVLFLLAQKRFLLLHILIELSCIVVGICAFAVVWIARKNVENGLFILVGSALLPVSVLTLLHSVTYRGMWVLPEMDADMATQLWVTSRILLAGAMISGVFFVEKRLRPWASFVITNSVGGFLALIIFMGRFPTSFVAGKSLTQLKIWAEYFVALLFLMSALGLLRKRNLFEKEIVSVLVLACLLGVGSGLSFTLYADPYGTMNMIGHVLAFALFVCLFSALVMVGIQKPQAYLLRELATKNENLAESEAFFSAAFRANPEAMAVLSLPDGRFQMVNEGFRRLTEYSEDEVVGKSERELGLWVGDKSSVILESVLGGEGGLRAEEHGLKLKSGCMKIAQVSTQKVEVGLHSQAMAIIRDVTREREADNELSRSRERLEGKVKERTLQLARANEALREEEEVRRKVQEELWNSKQELKSLSASLISSQERERKDLAREIHDSLGQILAAAKFSIERAMWELSGKVQKTHDQTVKEILRDAVAMVQGAIEEVRRIQMDLRPAVLDDLGLIPTLSWFLREFQRIYSHIDLKTNIVVKEEDVPDSLKIVIFRVLQEALNNVAKHSMASKVEIHLYLEQLELIFSIRDNGVGVGSEHIFSKESSFQRGIGIVGMRERVELSGGRFSLFSGPGIGTRLEARWTIDTQAQRPGKDTP